MDELHFFHGRRVLVTGHTGFKGAWLGLWLARLGAVVSGYALDPPTAPSLFDILGLARTVRHHVGDIRDAERLQQVLARERPEVVFHLAAQPLVRRGHREPKETFDVNVGGTVNLLEAVRLSRDVRAVVCVTSDKCYDGPGDADGHRETDALGGSDPYGASKAAAELVVTAYRESFFRDRVGVATARAGNVIGGGDWAEDRLVPDCIRALANGEPITLRRPDAVRPWQHVLEPLAGYLILAARLALHPGDYQGAWNFGPREAGLVTVSDLARRVVRSWGASESIVRIVPSREMAEAECLRLCSDKASSLLPWQPQWDVAEAVRHTVAWYRWHHRGGSPERLRQLALAQIAAYEQAWSLHEGHVAGGPFLGGRAR